MNRPYSYNYARLVPPVAGELFTKPSFWRLFTRSSIIKEDIFEALSRGFKGPRIHGILPALPMRSALCGFFRRCGSGSISRVLSPRKSGGVIIPLAPALLAGSSNLPGSIERAALKRSSIRSCSGWGLPCRLCHQRRGELLPRLFTLTPWREPTGRYVFCGTFPGVAPGRR